MASPSATRPTTTTRPSATGSAAWSVAATRRLATYRRKRNSTGAWLKVKCVQSDEYAIIGHTAGQGAREELGSLLLGLPGRDSHWRYLGRVGTGFDADTLAELLRTLKRRSRAPCSSRTRRRARSCGARAPFGSLPRSSSRWSFAATPTMDCCGRPVSRVCVGIGVSARSAPVIATRYAQRLAPPAAHKPQRRRSRMRDR